MNNDEFSKSDFNRMILEKSVGHGICGKSGRKRQKITRR